MPLIMRSLSTIYVCPPSLVGLGGSVISTYVSDILDVSDAIMSIFGQI